MQETKNDFNPLGWVPIALIAWFAVFGVYEIVERTLLQEVSPSLIYVLHIVRGTGTSFLLAGLVAWYILRRRDMPSLPTAGGLRTIVAETEARELVNQASWIIRLRWIAIAGVLFITFLCRHVFHVISGFSTLALVLIAITMAGYNALFVAHPPRTGNVIRMAFAQVFLDLVSLTLMIYFSGGISNPFFLFYLFHIVIAGILLRKGETYLVTLVACSLFCVMVTLQEVEIIPSFPLMFGTGHEAKMHVERGWIYVLGVLGAFITTAWCTAYFTTTIMDKLRRRGIEIMEASEILTQERAKTEDIVRSVGAGMFVMDLKNGIVWANDIIREWFGTDIIGGSCRDRVWQDDAQCLCCPQDESDDGGTPVTHERSVRLDGKQKFFLTNCSPIRSADGRVDQILVLIQDITAMKEMEIQLLQTGKMAAVGQLAAGIAHEINNPLAVVASSAEILAEVKQHDVDLNNQADLIARHSNKIGENVYRCKNIIQNLLAFSRQDENGIQKVDVHGLLDDTLQLVEGSTKAGRARIIRDYSTNGEKLKADGPLWRMVRSRPLQIQQVFLNLLMNALDATDLDGKVTISTERKDEGIEVAIADDGAGIAPEHVGRIFDPFFTTKPVGKGTGLGLYISHQIMESLNGKMSVESRQGEGSVFRVWLPKEFRSQGGFCVVGDK